MVVSENSKSASGVGSSSKMDAASSEMYGLRFRRFLSIKSEVKELNKDEDKKGDTPTAEK